MRFQLKLKHVLRLFTHILMWSWIMKNMKLFIFHPLCLFLGIVGMVFLLKGHFFSYACLYKFAKGSEGT